MPATNPYLDPVTPEMQAIIDQYAAQLGVPASRLAFVDGELLFLNDQGEVEQLNLDNTFGGGSVGSVAQFGAQNQVGQRGAPPRQTGRASLVPAIGQDMSRRGGSDAGAEGQGAQPGAGSVSEVSSPTAGAFGGSQVAQMGAAALAPGLLGPLGAVDLGLRGASAIGGLGSYGVVGGSNRPAVGSEAFDRAVSLGRQAGAMSEAADKAAAAGGHPGGPGGKAKGTTGDSAPAGGHPGGPGGKAKGTKQKEPSLAERRRAERQFGKARQGASAGTGNRGGRGVTSSSGRNVTSRGGNVTSRGPLGRGANTSPGRDREGSRGGGPGPGKGAGR